MLYFKLDGDILEVREVTHSFFDTKTKYVYYDLKNKLYNNKRHIKGETPDFPMTKADIDYVNKYYLPKVNYHKLLN